MALPLLAHGPMRPTCGSLRGGADVAQALGERSSRRARRCSRPTASLPLGALALRDGQPAALAWRNACPAAHRTTAG